MAIRLWCTLLNITNFGILIEVKINSFGCVGGLQLHSSIARHAVLHPQIRTPSLAVT
jgi:hypothetical protein